MFNLCNYVFVTIGKVTMPTWKQVSETGCETEVFPGNPSFLYKTKVEHNAIVYLQQRNSTGSCRYVLVGYLLSLSCTFAFPGCVALFLRAPQNSASVHILKSTESILDFKEDFLKYHSPITLLRVGR